MKITKFEDIESWQLARKLTETIYKMTGNKAFSRDFGLVDQIRRASTSIMANIAEGFDSGSDAEFIRFLCYSQRSCTEVCSHLYIALDQQYVTPEEFKAQYEMAQETKKKIGAFIKYLKSCRSSSTKDKGLRTTD